LQIGIIKGGIHLIEEFESKGKGEGLIKDGRDEEELVTGDELLDFEL